MELTAREDVDVPIAQAFEILTDVEVYERSALRRGAEVARLDNLTFPGVGAKWEVALTYRGKPREIQLEITGFDAPNEVQLKARVQGIGSDIKVELVALSRTRTRIQFWTGMQAQSLTGRLVLQSLKLARSNLNSRLAKRLEVLRADMEKRFNSRA